MRGVSPRSEVIPPSSTAARPRTSTVREESPPPREAGGGLPCLSSNNSDETTVKACGIDRKRAERTRQNIAHFASRFGSSVGVLTITFAHDLDTRSAQRKLANFKRRVLKENFGESVTVREFTARGRPHFHLVIDCLGDITAGFDWSHYDAVTAWSKGARKSAKPRGNLNRTPRLAALHRILAEKAPLYGLGRIELVPVKKPEAIGFYLGGYLAKSLAHKPADAKGTRSVNYSRRCPQILSGKWSWNNPSGWLWRQKLRTWATRHGCETFAQVYSLFGPKWAFHHREAILETPLSYYPTAEHARRDGHFLPADAVDIRVSGPGRLTRVERTRLRDHLRWDSPLPCAKRSGASGDGDGRARVDSVGVRESGSAPLHEASVSLLQYHAVRHFRLRSYDELREAGKLPRQVFQRRLRFAS